jgi:hypothetical protein
MNIQEIENLSAEELKSRRMELAGELSSVKSADLVPRYLSTLIDAKMRDEKLSEQGSTIRILQESINENNT